MSGIVTDISNSGTIVDIAGVSAVFIILFIAYFVLSKRKKHKEEMRHHDDKPELWNLNE